MALPFSRSLRSLQADGFRRSLWTIGIAVLLLTAWAIWMFLSRVRLYEVSARAEVQVRTASYPIEAPLAGQILALHFRLGQGIHAGKLLVDLDPKETQLQIAQKESALTSLAEQLDAIGREIRSHEESQQGEREAAEKSVGEAWARHREADVAARFAEDDLKRLKPLLEAEQIPQVQLVKAEADAEGRRAATETLQLAAEKLEKEQEVRKQTRLAEIAKLQGQEARLHGERDDAQTWIERLRHDLQKHQIRAPVSGRIGEVTDLQVGMSVAKGNKFATLVPPGTLRAVGEFPPSSAVGRIRPGQTARLMLESFPWTQYGSFAATVGEVASEAREGNIRVEFIVDAQSNSQITLQHGMRGVLEVEVERLSPAYLLLRAAGNIVKQRS